MAKGARPPGPVFLPVCFLLRHGLEGAVQEPGELTFLRAAHRGLCTGATAQRVDRREVRGISYDYNRGMGATGGQPPEGVR